MDSGSLTLLYFLLGFHGGRQGSGPNRGQSPIELGDFPSVRLSIHLSVRPKAWLACPDSGLLRPSWLGLRPEVWLAGPEAWLAGPEAWLAGP